MTFRAMTMLLTILACLTLPAAGQDEQAAPVGPTVLLDTYGFWRMHNTLRPPLVERADGTKAEPLEFGYEWIDCETADTPDGWMQPEFDDSTWSRGTAHMACHTPYLARLAMRGYFTVADPAKAGDLALTVVYQGGAIVYLNGREVARGYVAKAAVGQELLAEPYPPDAFVGADGKLLRGWDKRPGEQDAESRRRIALRTRELKGVKLPRELLRKGINVLAVEIVRAAYPAACDLGKPPRGSWIVRTKTNLCELNFDTCELVGVQLTSTGGQGVQGSAVRAPGLRVWNGDVMAGDFDQDFGGQGGEPLHPVRIVAARGGPFSGKFVVGSDAPLRGLKVTVGHLTGEGVAPIPASAVEVRYGVPWGLESGAYGAQMGGYDKGVGASLTFRYTSQPTLLGALETAAPDEVAVSQARANRYFVADPRIPAPPDAVPGAVVPVWLTARVPRGAAPGRYTGQAFVGIEGDSPLSVPLVLTVCPWTLPDPQGLRTWIDMIESPDTLSLTYDVPLWSERHWQLIARSMDLLREVNNRVLYVPLIAECNHGNAESMVRWIDRGGGKYDWEFSVMDRYLDTCLAHMGRPEILVLYVWDIYLAESKQLKPGFDEDALGKAAVEAREEMKTKGPMVTVLDPTTGKVETRHLPKLSDPASKPLWKGMFDALWSHLEARSLKDRVMLGMFSDAWPSKADADFFAETAGREWKWFSDSHMGIADFQRDMKAIAEGKASKFTLEVVYPSVKDGAAELSVLARAAYNASVWCITLACEDPAGEGRHGWARQEKRTQHDRHANVHPMARWHLMPEMNILGEQRGIGRLGGDWWRCVRNRRGQISGNARDRYPHASWRNLDNNVQMLAPGPDGAVATHRFENLREGLLECEARITIEEALMDPGKKARLGADLARKAEEVLRRRANLVTKACSNLQMSGVVHDNVASTRAFYMWPNVAGHSWFLSADWQALNEELFTTAGAVADGLRDD